MLKSIIFPGRYIQGPDALSVLDEELARLGHRALAVCDPFVHENLLDATIRPRLGDKVETSFETFGGECTDEEVERLGRSRGAEGADVVVGIGGGKALDLAKATSLKLRRPVAIVPTVASTDAPCSSEAVIYTPAGEVKRHAHLPRNPDLVLLDTSVIARAPVRMLVAGMGDALATWFEARSCRRASAPNMTGYRGTETAFALARLCYEILLEDGALARRACEVDAATPALERIVEANTLLSGVGFESGGLATAHALDKGLLEVPGAREMMHGERVAFGTLASLHLNGESRETIDEVYAFCRETGLPTTFETIGLGDASGEDLRRVAEVACAPDAKTRNEPRDVNSDDILSALRSADAEGRRNNR